jgi:hypothetical protein
VTRLPVSDRGGAGVTRQTFMRATARRADPSFASGKAVF